MKEILGIVEHVEEGSAAEAALVDAVTSSATAGVAAIEAGNRVTGEIDENRTSEGADRERWLNLQ